MAHDKTYYRMQRAIRLSILQPGLTDAEIAEHIGLSHAGYTTMKQRLEYKQLAKQITSGVLSEMDAEIGEDITSLRRDLRSHVPVALQALYDAALASKDPKLKIVAATEILDRDGRFAKVSRVGLPTEDQGGVGIAKSDSDIASEIIAADSPVKLPIKTKDVVN